jgi:hypothetical protein
MAITARFIVTKRLTDIFYYNDSYLTVKATLKCGYFIQHIINIGYPVS